MIRRIRRTLVVEYVTDRADNDLPVVNRRDIAGRVVSEAVDVVDAAVDPKVAAVEALVSQGVAARAAGEMFDRQRAAYLWELGAPRRAEIDAAARVVAQAAADAARASGGDPIVAFAAAYTAEKTRLEAEPTTEEITR